MSPRHAVHGLPVVDLLILSLVVVATPAAAQTVDTIPAPLGTTVDRLNARSIVRVRLYSGEQVAGPVLRRDAAALEIGPFLGYAERPVTVHLGLIDSLWTRGSSAGRMSWQGALLGGMTLAGIASIATTCEGDHCSRHLAAAALGGLGGGALLGALVGSATPRWRTRYGRAVTLAPRWTETPDSFATSWRLWTAVSALPRGPRIRLVMNGGPDVEGIFEHATAVGLSVRPAQWPANAAAPVAPASSIQRLYERGDSRTLGGVLGGVLGLTAAALPAVVDDTCLRSTSQCAPRFLAAGVLGGAAGAFLGRAIGRAIPHWHRRF